MIPPALFVAGKQQDLKLFVEEFDERPPVASIDHISLKRWAEQIGFRTTEVSNEAMIISDSHKMYKQLWVARSVERCRPYMIDFLGKEYGLSADFSDFDADHVVARTRLRSQPDAWINLFPVKSTWNRFFGAIEQLDTLKVSDCDFLDGLYKMTGFEALKLFYSNIGQLVDAAKKSFATENATTTSLLEEMDQFKFL